MLFALLGCVVVVGAVHQTAPSFSFSGAVNGPTISSISRNSDGSCSTASSGLRYKMVNHTFATAGVRTINGFGIEFIGVTNASHPYPIDLTNLCNHSSVFPLIRSGSLRSRYSWAHWFEANTLYTFTLGSSSSSESYGAEFWDGMQGQTAFSTQMNRTWMPLTESSGDCYETSSLSLYDTKVVSLNTSGYYNVFVGFSQNTAITNSEPNGYVTVTVLRGEVSGSALSIADCTTVSWVAAFEGSDLTAQGFSVMLDANQNYTFVVSGGYISGGDSYYGHYVLTLSPARRVNFANSLAVFQPPSKNTCEIGTACQSDSSWTNNLPYGMTYFKVPANSYFYIDATENRNAAGDSSRDLAFYLYSGQNPTAATCGGITSDCASATDYLSGVTMSSGAVSDWTFIVQGWFESNTYGVDASSDLYIISGPSLDPNTNTAAPTSSVTAAPTSSVTAAPTSSVTAAPTSSTVAPTKSGTAVPTSSSVSVAPSTASSNSTTSHPTTAANINSSPLLNPGLASLCALAGFLLM